MSLQAILWVLSHSETTLGSRLVLLALADNADDDGCDAYPSVPTIARKARMSEKGAREALRRLERDAVIRQTGVSPYGTNIYEIVGLAPGENPGDDVDGGGEVTSAPPEDDVENRTPTSPEPSFERSKDKHVVVDVASAWGKHAPPLIRHPAPYFESKRFETAVASALRTYELPAVVKAIENYAQVLASPAHYWTHRYSAVDFLRRERATPGVEKFVDEAVPFENFRTKKDADRDGREQRTPAEQLTSAEAWILNTAWRLPLEEWDVAEQLGQRGVEGPDRSRLLDLWRQKRDLAA